MRIYFEHYTYPEELIEPFLKDVVPVLPDRGGYYVEHIGYLFVSNEAYSGPIFVLPQSFLLKDEDGKKTLLGMHEIYPDKVIDTDRPDNPLAISGYDTFLPELSLWLFRAMCRYREDSIEKDSTDDLLNLDYIAPENTSHDRDFLSTAIRLMDFLSDHRNLFTQISIINHSGKAAVDWKKTVQQDPFFCKGQPYYLDLCIKDKTVNIDEELIVIYYSVLKYLKDKYHFPINLGEVPYTLKNVQEIQRYLDTGIGQRHMRDIRGKYFRDDLKYLWSLLDSFFTFNTSRDNKNPRKEMLVIKNFKRVFEVMVDQLIGDTDKLTSLKSQKDGKLIDHIYLDKSLIGPEHNIYYIGDSKYYEDDHHAEGVSLYKQFTYARNTIQYNIDLYHLKNKKNPNNIRYRDKETEGYNITPNFFVMPKVEQGKLDFSDPDFAPTEWKPKPNKHFEDRLFDRDTLLLREYEINLIFLIAAYGSYETSWTNTLRQTIREDMLQFLTDTYTFFKIQPKDIPMYSQNGPVGTIPFVRYFHSILAGKAYKEQDNANEIYLAFEQTPQGERDSAEVLDEIKYAVKDQSALSHPIKLKQ